MRAGSLGALLLPLLLGCGDKGQSGLPGGRKAFFPDFRWDGVAPDHVEERKVLWPQATLTRAGESLQATDSIAVRRLVFNGTDTLIADLFDFERNYDAFALFRRGDASIGAWKDGYFRQGIEVWFLTGTLLGRLRYDSGTYIPSTLVRESLAGMAGPALPAIFDAFPLHGRLANSESVVLEHAWAIPISKPMFTVRYPCHGDTAILFRIPEMQRAELGVLRVTSGVRSTSRVGKAVTGLEGVSGIGEPVFWDSGKQGIYGVSGCPEKSKSLIYMQMLDAMSPLLDPG